MKRTLSKLLALVLIVTVIGAMAAVPAMASESPSNLNNSDVTITKHLVLIGTEYAPEVTFTYTIANGSAVGGSTGNYPIYAGTLETPITATVAYSSSSTVSDNFTSTDTALNGQHYADGAITVSGITDPTMYERPGIYRYTITESAVSAPYTIEDDDVRYIDVYVEYTTVAGVGDSLTVSKVILYDSALSYSTDGTTSSDGGTLGADDKTTDFTNSYETHSLTFSKTVTGNQGDKTKEFTFHVVADTSTQFTAGDKFKITMTNVSFPEGSELSSTTIFVTGEQLNNGFDLLLKNDSSIVIEGIPATHKVTITENPEGYTQSFAGTGSLSTDTTQHSATATLSSDATVEFQNTLTGVIPTGILLTVAPFAVGLLLFGSIVIFLAAKKRRAEDED
ncbi:MAG: hypothetical protein IKS66_06355 [Oscillospiraceae bacterium]|nr:hypothetical protein [Oscillospiraceae bacterium]